MSEALSTTGAPSPAESVLSVMQELIGVLEQELSLVKKQDVKAIQDLRRNKCKLILDYKSLLRTFSTQPELLKDAAPAIRGQIMEVGQKLEEVTRRNAAALKAAAEATQRIVQTVVRLLKKEVFQQAIYKDLRKAHLKLGSYSPTCPPVTIDRKA